MNKFTKLIRDLLADRLEQLDAGNSKIDEETAIAAGYRPCGICMREAYKQWKAQK